MPVVTIVGKTWLLHVREILRTTPEENLVMIEDSVRHLVAEGREVIYDAEHFFDGYLENPDYALRTLEAAARGGASNLSLCETRRRKACFRGRPDHGRRGFPVRGKNGWRPLP